MKTLIDEKLLFGEFYLILHCFFLFTKRFNLDST